jgi:ribosome recycling factor
VGLLNHITVDYYGSEVPIGQAANLAVEDARTLTVTPWDKSMVAVIEKAILSSDLGLNPSSAGTVIRVPMPPLTEERRKELVKVVRELAENARVAVRNIRRDANNDLKALLNDKDISEDEDHKGHELVQQATKQSTDEIETLLQGKENELMEI